MTSSERAHPPARGEPEKPEKPAKPEKAAVARLRQRDDVGKALEQTAPGEQDRRPDSRRPKTLLIVEAAAAALLGILVYLVETERLRLPVSPFGIWQRVPLALFRL